MDDLLSFDLPTNFASLIKVIGVGGGGSNAVDHMFKQGIAGVDFIITNTDFQALAKSPVETKIQLGKTLTEGLGAGNEPEIGKESAIEDIEEVKLKIGTDTKMVFITAGMGGGTGTGAAPEIAKAAKEMGILTVGIVTIPFKYEGEKRIKSAIEGINKMEKHVDALLVINNEKIREIYGNLGVREALGKADQVLTVAAKGIAEIITLEGYINVDFADVKTVMKESGIAIMGTGEGEGETRAEDAVKEAMNSPLLDNTDIRGAKNILLNITSGKNEATLDETGYINEYVQKAAGNKADLIWGSTINEDLGDKITVTVIATGFGTHQVPELYIEKKPETTETDQKKKIIIIGGENKLAEEDNFYENYTRKEPKIKIIKDTENEIQTDEYKEVYKIEDNSPPKTEKTNKEETEFEFVETSAPEVDIIEEETTETNEFQAETYKNNLENLENTPAFKRKGIKLKQDNYSSNREYSRITLSEIDGEIEINQNNKYLHDKAD